jgi:hypothetical protein
MGRVGIHGQQIGMLCIGACCGTSIRHSRLLTLHKKLQVKFETLLLLSYTLCAGGLLIPVSGACQGYQMRQVKT